MDLRWPAWNEVAAAFRRHYELSRGNRSERMAANEQLSWAWARIDDGVRDGPLPQVALDALVRDELGRWLSESGAGIGPDGSIRG